MIIVVANSKGGVGKSTLAVHLAGWLHEQGRSVILADCDKVEMEEEIRAKVGDTKNTRVICRSGSTIPRKLSR